MLVRLQCVQLITDKTDTADLSSNVLAILVSVTKQKIIQNLFPQILSKTGKEECNKGSTELYCRFIAADSIVDTIIFITHIVL